MVGSPDMDSPAASSARAAGDPQTEVAGAGSSHDGVAMGSDVVGTEGSWLWHPAGRVGCLPPSQAEVDVADS